MKVKNAASGLVLFGICLLYIVIKPLQSGTQTALIGSHPDLISVSQQDTVKWNRPRFSERKDDREELVREIRSRGEIDDPEVLDAIRHVPRHLFVPENFRNQAYENNPLPIGHGQTISQPFVVAFMTQMLNLEPGDKVLEIGTGSGYHSAVLSELTPHVYSIEIIRELGEAASRLYDELGYNTIRTKIGDSYFGLEEHAPFDAIIVTAAAGHIPSPLMEQLKPGGIMAIPIGNPYQAQVLMKVEKTKKGKIRTERILPVRFVPMTGEAQN
ncbi:MAG TPA: protein-L-isoaspartate(D-aspartate) O-methyltransferase [Balneolaceae bacterium]|nr:protein-L-isoaspartate(D-aspartate) O-methyltransferase [Balneolaceae bacterium]